MLSSQVCLVVTAELQVVLLPVRSTVLGWQDKHTLSWPALVLLLLSELRVAHRVVLRPVVMAVVQVSCARGGFAFHREGNIRGVTFWGRLGRVELRSCQNSCVLKNIRHPSCNRLRRLSSATLFCQTSTAVPVKKQKIRVFPLPGKCISSVVV